MDINIIKIKFFLETLYRETTKCTPIYCKNSGLVDNTTQYEDAQKLIAVKAIL